MSRDAVRSLLVALSQATIGCVAASPALAQDAGTIRMVVPFGPGTTTDSVGRVVADGLSKALKQNVVVDNRAGAGGVTGSDQVAKSPADEMVPFNVAELAKWADLVKRSGAQVD